MARFDVYRAGSRLAVAWVCCVPLLFMCACTNTSLVEGGPITTSSLRAAAPSQAAILADGIVTPAERAMAHDAMLECIEDAGIKVLSAELRPTGDSLDTDNAVPGTSDIVANCRAAHYSEVGLTYTQAQ